MEGSDSELAKFTVATSKAFLKAYSQNVSGNKQSLVTRLLDAEKHTFFRNSQSSGQQINNAKTLFSPTLHHLSPVIIANTTVAASVLICNSRFDFHYYTQRKPMSAQ